MEEKGKILIIDDNEDVLFALNLLLEPYMEQIRVTTQPTRIEHFTRHKTICDTFSKRFV